MSEVLQQAVELGRLKADVRRLLQKIEWDGDDTAFLCPACGESKQAGHAKTCPLVAVMELVSRDRGGEVSGRSTDIFPAMHKVIPVRAARPCGG